MTLPTKAAVSRMTRLILVFSMVLSLVGGTLYSAQAKSIYNIKADSNVITTVEGITADTGSPVVDQILEQAGIEVGSTDVVEVTVTSATEEEDSPAADESDSSEASAGADGSDASSAEAESSAAASSGAESSDVLSSKEDSSGASSAEAVGSDASASEADGSDTSASEAESSDASASGEDNAAASSSPAGESNAAAAFAAGIASEQVVESLTSDAAESQQADGSAPDSSETGKQETEKAQTSEKKADASAQETEDKTKAEENESKEKSEGKTEAGDQSKEKAEGKTEADDQSKDKAEAEDKEKTKSDDKAKAKADDKAKAKSDDKAKSGKKSKDADAETDSADKQTSEQDSGDGSKLALTKAEKEEEAQSSAEQERQEADESAQQEQDSSDSNEPDESSVQVSGDKIITVTVTRPKYVTVTVDKTLTSVQLQPGDTVRDVIERLNIVLGEHDLVSQELDAEPDVSAPITINRVELSYFKKVKTEEHGTVRKPDPKKYIGTEYVKREGVDYKKVDTYEKKIIDGGEPIITKVKTDITEMKDEIVCYGTKVDSPSPSGLSASHNVITNRDEENGTITLSDGSTYSYYSVSDSFAATAYCGGGTTSTGRAAQVGVVAVDPSVIPYGTRMYITSGSIVYGVCVAGDTGVSGHLIDLYFNSASHCRAFGRRGITVYFLD